ncbi:MAG: nitrilase-related carbon-nitrogen hydrolase, partial [Nitrosopumilus sp.]
HYGGLFCGYSVPNDVLTEFIKRYGKNSLFPVVDTPIGKLGALICFDTNFPEVARCLALNGAEVMIHSTGEPRGWYREYWELAKRSRAYENVAYLVSVNRGNWIDTILPVDESQGRSMVVDYTGRIVAVAETGNESLVRGEINIEALRQRRQNPLWNFIGQLQNGLHAESYKREIWPSDHFAKKAPEDADDYAELQAKIMDMMVKRGIVKKPAVKRRVTPTTVS